MSDEVPIYRQWLLLRTLGARRCGVTVREMAREMGVAEKTIRRDLELFGRLGFPLEEIGRRPWPQHLEARRRLEPSPSCAFTFDEAVVLYLGRPFLEPLAGTQLWQAANTRMRKIRATLEQAGNRVPRAVPTTVPLHDLRLWRLRATRRRSSTS